MTKKIFGAYGDNVLIEKQEVINSTVMGKVIHSNRQDLIFGDIVLYNEYDSIPYHIAKNTEVDIVWAMKIRAKLVTKN